MRYRISTVALAAMLASASGAQAASTGERPQSQSSERALRNAAPTQQAQTPPLNESTPPPVEEIEERAMEKRSRRPPPRSQATPRAADEAVDARRADWAGLDANGDGKVSVDEGRVDADFSANFEMMDIDRDGFVTEAEFRTHGDAGRQRRRDDGGRDPARRDRR